jgi:hypothetical protein
MQRLINSECLIDSVGVSLVVVIPSTVELAQLDSIRCVSVHFLFGEVYTIAVWTDVRRTASNRFIVPTSLLD